MNLLYIVKWLLFLTVVCGVVGKSKGKIEDITNHPNWKLVNPPNCGKSQQMRIIGGQQASLGQFPWIVRLGYSFIAFPDHITMKCGGAIINKRYILTAGHCFRATDRLKYVRVGELDDSTNPDCEDEICAPKYKDYKIEEVIINQDHNKPTLFSNDITLIRVKKDIQFNDYVAPICLEYGSLLNNSHENETAEVAGWGIYDMDLELPSTVLQYLSLPIMKFETCYNALKQKTTITKKQICAGGIKGKDSCGGDSGGPLMKPESIDNQPPRYYLLGIVSFGTKQCAETTIPSVYTRVSSYLNWILDNIKP